MQPTSKPIGTYAARANNYIGWSTQQLKALVVEDDACLAEIVQKTLGLAGFAEVAVVGTVEEAIHVLADDSATAIDLVASDLALPHADGFKLLSYLAGRRFAGTIVLMSGMNPRLLETARIQAESSGLQVLGALAKPFSIHDLLHLVQNQKKVLPGDQGMMPFLFKPWEFEDALEHGHIRPQFQPIVDVKTTRLLAIEALARWHHPEHGLIPPGAFIQTLEQGELIHELTLEMLHQCLQATSKLSERGLEVNVAVNLSSGLLAEQRLPERIYRKVSEFGISPSRIVLEITETQTISDLSVTMENLNRLSLLGFRLSVDDYGTGYSSLERVRKLPFSELKVDRQFVRGAGAREDLKSILRHCIDLSRELELNTVAEGVETEEDWKVVQELGFDAVQGFYVSRPLSSDDLLSWASRQA